MGKNLRKLRESRGWTQEELAAKLQTMGCDLTRSAVAKLEAGQRHFYADEIKTLKLVLQVDYIKLFI